MCNERPCNHGDLVAGSCCSEHCPACRQWGGRPEASPYQVRPQSLSPERLAVIRDVPLLRPDPVIKLSEIVVTVCEMCLSPTPTTGTMKGDEECHTPGCVFWMDDAPIGRTLDLLRQWASKP